MGMKFSINPLLLGIVNETMVETQCLLVFTLGNQIRNQGFLGGAKWILSIHCTGHLFQKLSFAGLLVVSLAAFCLNSFFGSWPECNMLLHLLVSLLLSLGSPTKPILDG